MTEPTKDIYKMEDDYDEKWKIIIIDRIHGAYGRHRENGVLIYLWANIKRRENFSICPISDITLGKKFLIYFFSDLTGRDIDTQSINIQSVLLVHCGSRKPERQRVFSEHHSISQSTVHFYKVFIFGSVS